MNNSLDIQSIQHIQLDDTVKNHPVAQEIQRSAPINVPIATNLAPTVSSSTPKSILSKKKQSSPKIITQDQKQDPLTSVIAINSPPSTSQSSSRTSSQISTHVSTSPTLFDPQATTLPLDVSNLNIVYAIHTFVASLEGQASVLKGDTLVLLDDSHSYWWLIRSLKTSEIGYIPADNIESQNEKLARLNKTHNVKIAAPTDAELSLDSPKSTEENSIDASSKVNSHRKGITFADHVIVVEHSDNEFSDNEDFDGASLTDEADSSYADSSDEEIMSNKDQLEKEHRALLKSIHMWGRRGANLIRRWMKRVLLIKAQNHHSDSASSGVTEKTHPEIQSRSMSLDRRKTPSPGYNASMDSSCDDSGHSDTSSSRNESIRSVSFELGKNLHTDIDSLIYSPVRSQKINSSAELLQHVNPILVLKIFSGNYDFKATYKAVSVTKDTTVSDVIKQALHRFKVTGPHMSRNIDLPVIPQSLRTFSEVKLDEKAEESVSSPSTSPESYYLSVVHGDSKERKLHGDDLIMDILLKLQSKTALPGVAPSSQKEFIKHMRHVNAKGQVSSIRTPNDSEIKFLLNIKRPTDFTANEQHGPIFIRVYYYGDHFNTGTLRSYKTIAIKNTSTVKNVIDQAVKKFKITSYEGCELWRSKEQLIASIAIGSEVNVANLHQLVDPFSPALKSIESVIIPSELLKDDALVYNIVKDRIDLSEFAVSDEMAFVLKFKEDQDSTLVDVVPDISSIVPDAVKTASGVQTATDIAKPVETNPIADIVLSTSSKSDSS